MALKAGPKPELVDVLPPRGELGPVEFITRVGTPPYRWQAPILAKLGVDARPRAAYVQVPRKVGKSKLAADLILNEMCNKAGRQIFLIADTERNLRSALFFELCDQVRKSPILSATVHIYKDHLECPVTGGGVWLRPNNLSASQSINPDVVCFDEVHMQRTDSVWNGMYLAGSAKPHGLLLGITTPGYDLTSPAHTFYGRVMAGEMWGVVYETSQPWDSDEALFEANPVLVERPDMLEIFREERRTLPEHDYRRFRLGQWTASGTAWLPYGAWTARRSSNPFEWTSGTWVGFDGSHSGDSSALVAVNPAGQLTVLGLWEKPSKLTGRHADEWRVPRGDVQRAVRAAMDQPCRPSLVADPPYWRTELQEWGQLWPRRVFEFPTSSNARMAPACTTFYSAVMEGRIHDCSPDGRFREALSEHLANASTKATPNGTVIVKQTDWSPRKIDLAVAAVIAASHALVPTRPERKILVL